MPAVEKGNIFIIQWSILFFFFFFL